MRSDPPALAPQCVDLPRIKWPEPVDALEDRERSPARDHRPADPPAEVNQAGAGWGRRDPGRRAAAVLPAQGVVPVVPSQGSVGASGDLALRMAIEHADHPAAGREIVARFFPSQA